MKKLRLFVLILALCMFLQAPAYASRFYDVKSGSWCEESIELLADLEIISGYSDGSYRPDNTLTRGEFLKMISIAGELWTATPSKGIHWAESYWQMAYEAELLTLDEQKGSLLFQCTKKDLDTPISRYEASVLSANVLTKAYYEPRVIIHSPESGIKDYSDIPMDFKDSVEQAYGKGIITGYDDGSFQGDDTLTRAQAAVITVRVLWASKRIPADFAEEAEVIKPVEPASGSFAFRYRNMSVEERRIAMFGDANKTHFTSSQDAGSRVVAVTIPVWKIGSNGEKYATNATIYVHSLVKDEVEGIFREIFNDPEKFPIKEIGGARYSDALRHSWGCAIDINPTENYYCRSTGGSTTAIVGSHWSPGSDPYSITPNGSVVRAFAKYGWGWGGQGWSGGYYDYMHFSILPTGG